MTISIAGAPVSFGVFELTPTESMSSLVTPDELVTVLEETGYTGVDLGPVGYLGRGEALRARLADHGLELAGGWVDLPFSDDGAFDHALEQLRLTLDIFDEAAALHPLRPPKPTLADSGSDERRAHPGGGPGLSLDENGWARLERNVERAAAVIRGRGLEPTFHHHACTYVETPEEIDEFIRRTDVGLTFDTGHVLIGGGDPLEGWRRWASRVNHVHMKDVRLQVLRDTVAGGGGIFDVWSARTFVPLGQGDLDVTTLMDEIVASGYDGWLVVEQDVIATGADTVETFQHDHEVNRLALRQWA
jgi:inosose dehydratase